MTAHPPTRDLRPRAVGGELAFEPAESGHILAGGLLVRIRRRAERNNTRDEIGATRGERQCHQTADGMCAADNGTDDAEFVEGGDEPPKPSRSGTTSLPLPASVSWAAPQSALEPPRPWSIRTLGADGVIDYTQDDFADGTQLYDLILDIGGSSSLARLPCALTPKGTLVLVGVEDGAS